MCVGGEEVNVCIVVYVDGEEVNVCIVVCVGCEEVMCEGVGG